MTHDQRIDAALDSVLKASGSALKHYTMPSTLEKMREAMKAVLTVSADDCVSMREQIDEDNMEIAKLRLECTRHLTALHFWQGREETARHDALEEAAVRFGESDWVQLDRCRRRYG